MANEAKQFSRRPFGIWLISIYYLLSAGWILLSYALIYSGAIKINSEQEAYLASLTSVDWLLSLGIGVTGFAGAVALFLLRRMAVVLFSAALVLNLATIAFHMMRTNFTEALPSGGMLGMLAGLLILVAVILYARRLTQRGVLS